jgi:chromosome segregation ATPase
MSVKEEIIEVIELQGKIAGLMTKTYELDSKIMEAKGKVATVEYHLNTTKDELQQSELKVKEAEDNILAVESELSAVKNKLKKARTEKEAALKERERFTEELFIKLDAELKNAQDIVSGLEQQRLKLDKDINTQNKKLDAKNQSLKDKGYILNVNPSKVTSISI